MNRLVKDWIAALRSGKYRQTKGRLHEDGRYCATGVLGHLCGMKPLWEKIGGGMLYEQDGRCRYPCYLPKAVMNATGLRRSVFWQVTRRNDGGHTFDEIADYIEEQARRGRFG